MKCLGLESALEKTGLSKTAWYDGIKDGTFPAPLKAGRKSLWVEDEIDAALGRLQRGTTAAPPCTKRREPIAA